MFKIYALIKKIGMIFKQQKKASSLLSLLFFAFILLAGLAYSYGFSGSK
jgi:hypothetical protein